jgi:peptidoglycan hydrolase CwlO-like protein
MSKNWLKVLVAISAILIAGSAAFFSVTGLGVLFSGAALAVMIMAGSLEFAKLVTATYLKQEWNNIKGISKWYLTLSVVILMAITSAGIFGYLSNAFQQQNLKLDQIQREIQVWQNKIDYSNQQILTLQGQQKDLSTTQNTLITKGNVNSRLLRSVDNRDKQATTINKKINTLQDSIVSYNGKIITICSAENLDGHHSDCCWSRS